MSLSGEVITAPLLLVGFVVGLGVLFALALAASVVVIDGDTIRVDGERIRLLGVDSPEMSKCRVGRQCVPGDAAAAKASLESLIRGSVETERVGRDRYGRTLAVVRSAGVNLSCAQIARGMAVYVPAWDNQRRIAKECPILSEPK